MYFGLKHDGMTLAEIANATGGEIHGLNNGDITVYGVSTDTRHSVENSLFIALRGENFDGHDYISDAYSKGALCALTEKRPDTDKPYIIVKNTLAAYGMIAAHYRKKFGILSVSVTGSVGKTTTKEAICSVLSEKFSVCKTEANHNNEVGIPQTLLSLTSDHKVAVIEMGMVARGEISSLSKMTLPDISVITNIGSSHLEFLGSRENILKAKLEITDGMKDGGILLMNKDDDMLKNVKMPKLNCLYVGIDDPCSDFYANNLRESENGVTFDLSCRGETVSDLFIPSLGKHSVYAAAFGAACGMICGMDADEIRRGLDRYTPVKLRQGITDRGSFKKIEDCYNASPESMRASINVLNNVAKRNGGRAVAVLGEMRELGEFGPSLHCEVGEYASKNVDVLYIFGCGENINSMKRGYEAGGKNAVMLGCDYDGAFRAIKENIRHGDVILFKASRAVKLEKLSEKF